MSAVRAILANSRLPKSLQAEIIRVVIYIRNRSPRRNSILPSPYFEINGKIPNLKHLRILRLRAWVYIPKELRIKVQDRLQQGILVGYNGIYNYYIYNPTDGSISVTRSVIIDEKSLYNRLQNIQPVELVDKEQKESDDNEFSDPDEGDESHIYESPEPVLAPSALSYLPTPE